MKTVAAVSFHDNRQISMDMEDVQSLVLGKPIQLEAGQWFCELIIESANGKVALQMLADSPEHFHLGFPPEEDPTDE